MLDVALVQLVVAVVFDDLVEVGVRIFIHPDYNNRCFILDRQLQVPI